MLKTKVYPQIDIKLIKDPSRFYAIPLVGWILKIVMLFPVWVMLFALGIANFFVLAINAFYILFTGKYWKVAHELTSGLIRLSTKTIFFMYGLTNTYPGFSLSIEDDYTVDIPYPKNPSKFFAIPILGFVVRMILLIPFIIWQEVISRGVIAGFIVGSFIVFLTGKYPESLYEIDRDNVRLTQATAMYLSGLSDIYPAFAISWNHKVIKIILLIIGVLSLLSNVFTRNQDRQQYRQNYYQRMYNNSTMPQKNSSGGYKTY